MHLRGLKFASSTENVAGFTPETLPEFALIGRSNVGKSSLINALNGGGVVARVSGRLGNKISPDNIIYKPHITVYYSKS